MSPDKTNSSCANYQSSRIQALTDAELEQRLGELLANDNMLEADLLGHIHEIDRRKLYRERGYSSMFSYCVDHLHLAEAVAYKRITVARASGRYPVILDAIVRGSIHVTGAALLAPHLKPDNVSALLEEATHKSKREIERLLAHRFPKADVPSQIRKLPKRPQASAGPLSPTTASPPKSNPPALQATASQTSAPGLLAIRKSEVAPLSIDRFRVQFTADTELTTKIREAQELLGPQVGPGDLAELFSKALGALVRELKNKKHGVTAQPRLRPEDKSEKEHPVSSRTIPRSVRRQVYERDGGRCAYVSDDGTRCAERWGLEHHHRQAYALGGDATANNIELRCRSHNALAAEMDYGTEKMTRYLGTTDGSLCRERGQRYDPHSGLRGACFQLDPGRVQWDRVGSLQHTATTRPSQTMAES